MMSSVVLPELFFWEPASVMNLSCGGSRMECDVLRDLGPPPDMILNIPPPPVPPLLEDLVSRLAAEAVALPDGGSSSGMFGSSVVPDQASCNLCHWARGNNVGFVELAQKGPVIDDTWFLVIISSCVAATLVAIVLAIACLKYRDGKLKPLSDIALAKKEKALGLERCEAVLYPGPPSMAPPLPPSDPQYSSRALWAGLKPLDEKFYTVDHCQPMSQKQARMAIIQSMEDKYDYKHYTPINYATLSPMHSSAKESKPNHAAKPGTFENVGYVTGDENSDHINNLGVHCGVSRAAYLLGGGGSGRSTLSRPPSSQLQQQQQQQQMLDQQQQHHYEMVAPRNSPGMRRQMSLDRSGGGSGGAGSRFLNGFGSVNNNGSLSQHPPTISAPTNVMAVRLPPLNSRPGQYALTALANGRHTLTRTPPAATYDQRAVRRSQVALDRSGSTMTTLAPGSPTDHVYASPITSPVI